MTSPSAARLPLEPRVSRGLSLLRRLGGYAAVSLFGIGAAFGLITPLLEIGGNSQRWMFPYIPALASLMIAAIGWLALLSGPARLTRRRAEAGSGPASSRGAERRGA